MILPMPPVLQQNLDKTVSVWSKNSDNKATSGVTQPICNLEEPILTDLPANDPTTATTSTTSEDEDFPYCLLHLPAGDHHKPVLVVMRESDAHKLLQGPYFSKVTTE
ncbi:hypothetical protein Pmani_014673 [Petrolisthes manimaculis]|uniref:Uncharacterized protein n=1 Tax=Petrolisthes manimaculis TaxID=1843537 RepID=A0AAE1PSD3_9EUCA|nr:hypothetical protein Pmani_014673 [Petrolisthes manimaculis]